MNMHESVVMQAMASELNMYETQVAEYKFEIERLSRDLQEAKKKYFMQRKKEQQAKYVCVLRRRCIIGEKNLKRLKRHKRGKKQKTQQLRFRGPNSTGSKRDFKHIR